jgi:hypothetical protein
VGPRVALAAAVTVGLFACVPSAAAQGVPDCAPDKALNFTLTSHDSASGEENPPLVATHEVVLQADFAGDATAISVTPSAGAQVVKQGSGSVTLFVPAAATLPVTVSWQQPANPDDPDGSRCAASRVVELPVLAPNPSRAVLDRVPGAPRAAEYFVSFRIEPARTRANLAPLEITLRTTGRSRLPSPGAKPKTWVVPLRNGDRTKYSKRIPAFTVYLNTAKRCRFYFLSCGAVFSQVASIRRGGDIVRTLAFTQPAKWAAPAGINVDVRPSGRPDQPFGFDVQVRQSGRLLARYRRAGRCRDERRSTGIFRACNLTVLKNFPR